MVQWLVGTGLSSPIGQALLATLGPEWQTLGLSRHPEMLSDSGHWMRADLANPRDPWDTALPEMLTTLKVTQVTGVVHLAGVVFADQIEGTTQDEWQRTIAVDLRAAFRLLQILKPWLNAPSSVVLVSSVDAYMQARDGPAAAYGAAKAGLLGLSRQLAAEWGPAGIRVNVVAPGALRGGMGPRAEVSARIVERTALRRLGTPEEIARVVAFLLGVESSFVTGAVLPVDGGLNLDY